MRMHRRRDAEQRRGKKQGSRPAAQLRKQQIVQEFALRTWESIDTPVALSLYLRASHGDWEGVARFKIDPQDYLDPMSFYLDYQAAKLMSKCPLLPTGINTRKAAEKKFIEAEAQCLSTNERFRDLATGVSPRVHSILHAACRKIADILGDVPTFETLDLAFGPGAAFGVRGSTSAYHKVCATLESTHSMVPILGPLLGEVPGWISADKAEVQLVFGSDLAFVSKDATTDRAICIEPLLNGFLQKGIGTYIRGRLKRHGIDLDDQAPNQRLAGRALLERLSTVDFSSASDTIAYGLVWNLLPPDWCELLDAARCDSFRYEGRWYPFQKFSSMGNAYTFELETLIFYALAYACCVDEGIQPRTGENLRVYGDDVIVPRDAFDLFKEVSEACGFTLNVAKSYKDGSFYESCGADFFSGHLVTPLRLKKAINTTEEIFYAANLTVRLTERLQTLPQTAAAQLHARCRSLARVHRWLVSLLPRHQMALGPYDEGDSWLIAPFDRVRPSQGFFGWWHKQRVAVTHKELPDDGLWPMSYALYSAYRAPRNKKAQSILEVDFTPVLWSEGAAVRNRTRYRMGSTQSRDWEYPALLAGWFWQGY